MPNSMATTAARRGLFIVYAKQKTTSAINRKNIPARCSQCFVRNGMFQLRERFEGLDRSGKTSQSTRLAEEMAKLGSATKKMNFPDRSLSTGKIVNEYLQNAKDLSDECIHLLFSANRWEAKDGLLKEINEGTSVVCDRYVYSGVSYSAAKGLPLSWCRNPDIGLPEPDVVVYLRISSEIAEQRGGYGEERYEKKAFQEKVGAQFENFCASDKNWLVVDGGKAPDEVAKDIREGLAKRGFWDSERGGILPDAPVGKLWLEEDDEASKRQRTE